MLKIELHPEAQEALEMCFPDGDGAAAFVAKLQAQAEAQLLDLVEGAVKVARVQYIHGNPLRAVLREFVLATKAKEKY
jgi:hypothetical protein